MRIGRLWQIAAALAGLWLAGLADNSASAGLLISVWDSTVGPNGHGRAEVLISSDSATDQLAGFSVQFEIVPTSGSALEFLDLGGGVPVDSHLTSPRYVFAQTGSAARDVPPAGAIGPGTIYVGLDASNSPSGVSGLFLDRLLTTLHFAPGLAAPPQIGDTFDLRLDLASSLFFDPTGSQIPFTITRQGTILVIPEPSAWLLAVLGLWPVVRQGRRPRPANERQSSAGGGTHPGVSPVGTVLPDSACVGPGSHRSRGMLVWMPIGPDVHRSRAVSRLHEKFTLDWRISHPGIRYHE